MREDHHPEPTPETSRSGLSPGAPDLADPIMRSMAREDLAEIAALERICFQDPWSMASFDAELKADPTSWCTSLLLGGKVVGYMVVWFVEDEAHLANLAVAPWVRRRGYAQRMLDRLYREAFLRGSRIIVLEVRGSNQAAMALYGRNRFLPGGVRKDYYKRPREDAVVMIRSLGIEGTNP
ncbi:MAG: ribosomal-protein-alanine N-acetyltransferase [Candidatus Eisenbacteria bacterium]|nr:ribosomal-protein-alanine N-acetyltransferase [Candidatus Eisenbacteria bacterium]